MLWEVSLGHCGSSARETGLAGRSRGTCSFGLYGCVFQEERTGLMVPEILHGIKKGNCEASMESGIAAALAQGGPKTWTCSYFPIWMTKS